MHANGLLEELNQPVTYMRDKLSEFTIFFRSRTAAELVAIDEMRAIAAAC